LKALTAGRSYITNGTFLEFTVDSNLPGDILQLQRPTRVPVSASAFGRNDFTTLELVYNGEVIQRVGSELVDGRYSAEIDTELPIDKPGWMAVRITGGEKNELGAKLFAHTSLVYLRMAGERVFDPEAARYLIEEMEQAIEVIPTKAVFSDPAQWEAIRQIYQQGIEQLQDRLGGRRRLNR
jgi:hypothetical protein